MVYGEPFGSPYILFFVYFDDTDAGIMGFSQFLNRFVIDFRQEAYVIQGDVFVGLMNGGFFAWHFRPERAAAFQSSCVRAAADCDRREIAARCLVEDTGKGGDEFAVYVVVQGR